MSGGNDTPAFGPGGTATVSRTSRPVWTIVSCWEVTGTTNPMRRGGAKSFVDDLGWSRGVVLSRAATLLRSIETQPYDSKICSLSDEHTSLSAASSRLSPSSCLITLGGRYRSSSICLSFFLSSSSDVREFDSHRRQTERTTLVQSGQMYACWPRVRLVQMMINVVLCQCQYVKSRTILGRRMGGS